MGVGVGCTGGDAGSDGAVDAVGRGVATDDGVGEGELAQPARKARATPKARSRRGRVPIGG
jgi:hypothetical protein